MFVPLDVQKTSASMSLPAVELWQPRTGKEVVVPDPKHQQSCHGNQGATVGNLQSILSVFVDTVEKLDPVADDTHPFVKMSKYK